jgi:hypothetical protein
MISKYSKASDIVTSSATITVPTGTVSTDANYGLTSLYDGNPAKPCKFTTAYATILFDFGSAQRLDAFAMPHHNIDAGLGVLFQGNASDSWGAPTLSASVTIGAHDADGHVKQAWVDLTGVSGYSVSGFRYWRLYIPATNSVAVQIGEALLVAQLRTLTRGIQDTIARPITRGYIPAMETEAGVKLYYERDVKQFGISGNIVGTLQDYADVKALLDDTHGPCRGFFFVLDSSVQHDGGLYVRATEEMATDFSAEQPVEFRDDVVMLPWSVVELSRGLPL